MYFITKEKYISPQKKIIFFELGVQNAITCALAFTISVIMDKSK